MAELLQLVWRLSWPILITRASPVRPIRGYYYLMSNKCHTRRKPVRYVSFPLSAFPKSSPLALEGIPSSSGWGKGEGGKYGLTNSECKSWLIVVDTVALWNFSTTTTRNWDGMERGMRKGRREISWNVWKVPPLRKLLATIASLNEILINYSTGNQAGMSNCLIRSRDSFGGQG